MKGFIIALCAILVLSALVWMFGELSVARLYEISDKLAEGAKSGSADEIKAAKALFEKYEPQLSLTVPDDTLCLIYTELCESVYIINSDDKWAALGMINRLVAEIEQAGRLNGSCFFAFF